MNITGTARWPLAGKVQDWTDRCKDDPVEFLRVAVWGIPFLIAAMIYLNPVYPLALVAAVVMAWLFFWPGHRLVTLLLMYLPLHIYLTTIVEAGGSMGPFSAMGMAKDLLIIFIFIAWLFGMIRRKYHVMETPINAMVFAFIGLVLVHVLNYTSLTLGIWGFRNYFEYVTLFFVAASTVSNVRQVRNALLAMTLGSIPVIVFGIVQFFTGDMMAALAVGVIKGGERVSSVFGDDKTTNVYGMYLMILALCSLGLFRTFKDHTVRFLLGLMAISSTVSIWFTFSRRSMLGLFLGLGILGFRSKHKKWFMASIAIAVIAMLLLAPSAIVERFASSFDSADATNTGRLHEWTWILERVFKNPVTALWGIGLGTVGPVSFDFGVFGWTNTHNSYLCTLGELGLVGLLLFLGIIAVILRDGFQNALRSKSQEESGVQTTLLAVLCALLFTGMFGITLHTVPTNIYFWVFTGYLYATSKEWK